MAFDPESILDDNDYRRARVITRLGPVIGVFYDGGDELINQAVAVQAGFDGLQAARDMGVEPIFAEGDNL